MRSVPFSCASLYAVVTLPLAHLCYPSSRRHFRGLKGIHMKIKRIVNTTVAVALTVSGVSAQESFNGIPASNLFVRV
jgi:hypothetical protein